MRIALVHEHYDEAHLEEVMEEMRTLGAPAIHAVWMECYGRWAALEGCHRIRAAKALGLVPEIIEVEYPEEDIDNPYNDVEGNLSMHEICDDHRAMEVKFED